MCKSSIGYLLWDVTRLIRKEFINDQTLQTLSLPQAKALKLISHYEGVKQVELAQLLEIKPMSLVKVIDQLVADGLIERRPDPNDRRAHLIYLKPEAEDQLAVIKEASERIWANALKGLTDKQKTEMMEMLRHIHGNLSR